MAPAAYPAYHPRDVATRRQRFLGTPIHMSRAGGSVDSFADAHKDLAIRWNAMDRGRRPDHHLGLADDVLARHRPERARVNAVTTIITHHPILAGAKFGWRDHLSVLVRSGVRRIDVGLLELRAIHRYRGVSQRYCVAGDRDDPLDI